MGLKEDNDTSIDTMEAWTDSRNPDLPSTRKTRSEYRGDFDGVYEEMRAINDRTAAAYTALVATIDSLTTELAGKANTSVVTSIQTTITGILSDITSLTNNKQNKFTGSTSEYVRGDGSTASFPSTPSAYTDEMAQDAVGNIISASGGVAVSYNDGANTITFTTPKTFNSPTRSLNTSFQPSTTRDSYCRYSVQITAVAAVIAGQRGTVYLRYADNSGMSTNVVEVDRQSFGIGSGLVVTGYSTVSIGGIVPAGKYVQIVTANDTGTPSFAYQSAMEVLI